MAAKTKGSISRKRVSKPSHSLQNEVRVSETNGRYPVGHNKDDRKLPPPGPSNIIILTPNPLPPPRDVESQ